MHEILTAKVPYYEIVSHKELVKQICNGLRLQKPTKHPLPDKLWTLMQNCWAEPNQRPNFQSIYDQLTALLPSTVDQVIAASSPENVYVRSPLT